MVAFLNINRLSGWVSDGRSESAFRGRIRPLGARLACILLTALVWSPAAADVPESARKGASLFAESSYTEAAEAFRQATIASPDDPRWRYNLGLSEALDQKYDDALNNLSATSKLAAPAVASAALYNAGNVNFATGKYAEAA